MYWAVWGLGRQRISWGIDLGSLGGDAGAFCFLLLSKYNADLGTKGQGHIPLEDLHLGEWSVVGGGPRAAVNSLLWLSLVFLPRQGEPAMESCSGSPSTLSVLKVGAIFLHIPRERRDLHTGAEGPRAAGPLCSLPEPSIPRRSQSHKGWPEPLVFSTVHRGLSANLPPGRKMPGSYNVNITFVDQ